MRPGEQDQGGRRAPARKGFLLRLPPALLDELRGWAAQDLRSLNGQIEYLLRDALRRRRGAASERDGGARRAGEAALGRASQPRESDPDAPDEAPNEPDETPNG